ncbi:hypothetical protein EDB92DRAFT_1935954 [Lactarius akahatsu]|uniref:Uncharacterized protein n=1 Tax=Lactarius akahatsu TaxID=416441 RepID=A0AAD4LBU7_9AGAM|nr:hypothetical protein EDB92DRAFT_1935954 [Lactarius akahatsu]
MYSDNLESDDLSDVPANELDQVTSFESDSGAQGSACKGSQHSYASTHHPLSLLPFEDEPVPTSATTTASHLTISTPHAAGSDFDVDTDLSLSPPAGHTRRVPFTSGVPGSRYLFHLEIDGKPCQQDGSYPKLGEQLRLSCPPAMNSADWGAFESREGFEMAELLYSKAHMSEGDVDMLLNIMEQSSGNVPFSNHTDLYAAIDELTIGDVLWQSFTVRYNSELSDDIGESQPKWMSDVHEVFYHDPHLIVCRMLMNPDFEGGMDYSPYHAFDKDGTHLYKHMMGGDWAWEQVTEIAQDPKTHGLAFVPIILGSDKTTVSVAMGQTDYYPLYLSIGNLYNNLCQSCRGGVALAGFLVIAQTEKRYHDNPGFRRFHRQLFHTSLAHILSSLCLGMLEPEVVQCADGFHRRVIYGLGPYITDYPEQVLISCIVTNWCAKCTAHKDDLETLGSPRSREHTDGIRELLGLRDLWKLYGVVGDVEPFTNDFPCAGVYELLSPDLLHQIIKGTFKDHLVHWVSTYVCQKHCGAPGKAILDNIDWRIVAVPLFAGLRRFPEGRGFKQWTGDNSKALMKVYLPAIEGYVPNKMLYTIRAFLEFCYIARRNAILESSLTELEDALAQFLEYRTIFQEEGILIMNQHLNKLMAAGMLDKSQLDVHELVTVVRYEGELEAATERSCKSVQATLLIQKYRVTQVTAGHNHKGMVTSITTYIKQPTFPTLVQQFLYYQLLSSGSRPNADTSDSKTLRVRGLLISNKKVSLYTSASSIFFAPSNPCGIHGLRREQIQSTWSWRGGLLWHDVVLVNMGDGGNKDLPMSGYAVAQVLLFFSLEHGGDKFPAALVWWYTLSNNSAHRDEATEYNRHKQPLLGVVHIDTIFHAVHLLPYFGQEPVQKHFSYTDILDSFANFYVNMFADHHSFEIL